MTEPLLQIERLTKRFGGVIASDDIPLAVPPGELHAIIGPNGAGKTTLIGQLTGEIAPDSGRIGFGGVDITRAPTYRRSLGSTRRTCFFRSRMIVRSEPTPACSSVSSLCRSSIPATGVWP